MKRKTMFSTVLLCTGVLFYSTLINAQVWEEIYSENYNSAIEANGLSDVVNFIQSDDFGWSKRGSTGTTADICARGNFKNDRYLGFEIDLETGYEYRIHWNVKTKDEAKELDFRFGTDPSSTSIISGPHEIPAVGAAADPGTVVTSAAFTVIQPGEYAIIIQPSTTNPSIVNWSRFDDFKLERRPLNNDWEEVYTEDFTAGIENSPNLTQSGFTASTYGATGSGDNCAYTTSLPGRYLSFSHTALDENYEYRLSINAKRADNYQKNFQFSWGISAGTISDNLIGSPIAIPKVLSSQPGTTFHSDPFLVPAQGDYYGTISFLSAGGLMHKVYLDNYSLERRSLNGGGDETTLDFSMSAIESEEGESFELCIDISSPSSTEATTVDIQIVGTQTPHLDNYSTQSVTFEAGSEAQQCISISSSANEIEDANLSYIFELSNPQQGTNEVLIGEADQVQVNLADDYVDDTCVCPSETFEICLGQEVLIGCEAPISECGNYCYKWTPTEGVISDDEPGQDFMEDAQLLVSPEENTVYNLTVTDETGEIVAHRSYTVNILNTPVEITPSSAVFCPPTANSITLAATPSGGNYSYSWEVVPVAAGAFPDISALYVDVPGVYSVSVTNNDNGCVSVVEYELLDESDPDSDQAIKDFFKERGFLELEIEIMGDLGLQGETGDSRNPTFQYVRDEANKYVSLADGEVNLPEYLDNLLMDEALDAFDRHAYITLNDNFCAEDASGVASMIEEIDQAYQGQEYAYWIHLWESPDEGNDCLFIQCITPTHDLPMPESSAIEENIKEFLAAVTEVDEIFDYDSKDEQLAAILVNDLADFWDVNIFEESANLPYTLENPDPTDPAFCVGLTATGENKYCINVAGLPVTVPEGSLLIFNRSGDPESLFPYKIEGPNYDMDSRSLVGFMESNGKAWYSRGPGGEHTGFKRRENTEKAFPFPAIQNYFCNDDQNPITYFGVKQGIVQCFDYSLYEFSYRSNLLDDLTEPGPVTSILAGERTGSPVDNLAETGTFCNGSFEEGDPVSQIALSSCIPPLTQEQFDLDEQDAQFNPYGNKGLLFKLHMQLPNDPAGVASIKLVYAQFTSSDPADMDHYTYYMWDCSRGGWFEIPFDWIHQPQHFDFLDALWNVMVEVILSHEFWDNAGMIPVIGIGADVVSVVWYAVEGDYGNSALALVGIIPVFGDAIQVTINGTRVVVKIGTKIFKVSRTWLLGYDKALPIKAVMENAYFLFPDDPDLAKAIVKRYGHFLTNPDVSRDIANKTAALFENSPELLLTFKATEDAGFSLAKQIDLFDDLTGNGNNAAELVAGFAANPNLVKAWDIAFDNAALRVIAGNLSKIDNHLEKGIHTVDVLKAAFNATIDKAKWIDDIGYNVLRKADGKFEYINPNGKVIKWAEQHPNNFPNQIDNAINGSSANTGSIAEGEAAQVVLNQKPLEGFNMKRNLNGQQAAELDIVTADEVIEVKANINLAKDKFVFTNSNGTPGQIAKVKDSNIDEFVNPRGKPVILHVKEPLPINPNTGNYYPSDQAFIDELLTMYNIQFSNSLPDLVSKLQ